MNRKLSLVKASFGDVIKVNDIWFAHIDKGGDDLIPIPYTDHAEHSDTLLLRHNGKYGIFTLSGNGNNGRVNPDSVHEAFKYLHEKYQDYCMNYIALDDEPFPYDDARICEMDANFFGMIAYRKGSKWGIFYFFYAPATEEVDKWHLVPCEYSTFEEAVSKAFVWRTPSQKRAKDFGIG